MKIISVAEQPVVLSQGLARCCCPVHLTVSINEPSDGVDCVDTWLAHS